MVHATTKHILNKARFPLLATTLIAILLYSLIASLVFLMQVVNLTIQSPRAGGHLSSSHSDVRSHHSSSRSQLIDTVSIYPGSKVSTSEGLEQYLDLYKKNQNYTVMIELNSKIISAIPSPGTIAASHPRNKCWWGKSGSLVCFPGALLVGFAKCGTSDLYHKLIWHPGVSRLRNGHDNGKENHWWGINQHKHGHIHRGRPSFLDYLQNIITPIKFEKSPDKLLIDGSTSTVMGQVFKVKGQSWEERLPGYRYPPYQYSDVIHFIHPRAKIIAMTRNPVDMVWSRYIFFFDNVMLIPRTKAEILKGPTPERFHDLIVEQITKFQECMSSPEGDLLYCCHRSASNDMSHVNIHTGIFLCFLVGWRERFGDDHMLVLTMEEYSNRPVETVMGVFRFLGLETGNLDSLGLEVEFEDVANKRTKKRLDVGEMLPETRRLLSNFYRPYNRILAEYYHDDKFLFKERLERDVHLGRYW